VLLGPLTFLWLGKAKRQPFERLALLERLPVYGPAGRLKRRA
jgi:5-methyltetrahydropteroyltriglutamate--homocysteine methyltransferase